MIEAIPLAYFITFTCYGTWLHGGKEEGSIDRRNNIPETPRVGVNKFLHNNMLQKMTDAPYYLDQTRRLLVLKAIIDQCKFRHWTLLAAHERWTRHGSTRYLWKTEEVEAVINYVINEQGEMMAVYENKERRFELDGAY